VSTKINLKQIMGQDEMHIFVPKGSSLGELLALMVDTWGHRLESRLLVPGSDALLPNVRVEINERDAGFFSGLGTVLTDGDKVSLLPAGNRNEATSRPDPNGLLRAYHGPAAARVGKNIAKEKKMKLKDRVAIITGAAQGIGAAFALGFAKEGAKIVIADVQDGSSAVEEVKKAGGEAIFVKTDVGKQEECDAMAKAAMERFGRVDILLNNAAIFGTLIIKPFTQVTTEEWNRVMMVNTLGPFHCTKAVFPYMKDKGGKIINISSASIFEGVPGMPHYVASKGAVMAFTRCMAKELGGFNINVNSIAPGFTHSAGGESIDKNKALPIGSLEEKQMPARSLKRAAYPEDLVGTAVYLASDMSSFVTGQLIVHDGGMTFH
jgi:NAD(P)-dependent dehydrogenase (short-subunit alcohol dehydrogenase family)/molybdopterin converting factor small subunit